MKDAQYIVGIDLGTTNTVVAYKKIDGEENIEFLTIPQLVKSGQVEERNTLPSYLYLAGDHELDKKALHLPWAQQRYCVGEFARRQGSQAPDRLVSSAKSWLSHKGVDRKSNILPFQSADDLVKISPVELSRRYLEHIKNSWNHVIGKKTALENQVIYLTVPASFDAVARELTMLAAQQAGLSVTLLEEPQAAFYSWLYKNEESWRQKLAAGDLVLVVDVGGGTTDLSLVSVVDNEGNLDLQRDAVGDHILLGGDNMDLALAHIVSNKLPKANLDPWQSLALWHSCREAKEKMLADSSLDKVTVSILGRGSRLIGGTLKTKLTREELEKTLIEGFFLHTKWDDKEQKRKIGLSQMNLPYATEPAITRHIAYFLKRCAKESAPFAAPSAILFNGGVFKAEQFRVRTVEVINSWLNAEKKPSVKILDNATMDMSVAQGACYFGQVKQGTGIRIRGGIARSYYLGIESSMPAVPGMPMPMKALCVVPKGMEEGSEVDIPGMELGLTIGEPVEFPFYSCNENSEDQIGNVVDLVESMEQTALVQTELEVNSENKKGDMVAVKIHSKITEVGTLEISCRSLDEKQNWQLEFNIRNQE